MPSEITLKSSIYAGCGNCSAATIYSAPIAHHCKYQAQRDKTQSTQLELPPACKIELELATRFRTALNARTLASLSLADLPAVANLLVLFEIVRSRFEDSAHANALERIADRVSNEAVVLGAGTQNWTLDNLIRPTAFLRQDGVLVARHQGFHPAQPLDELLDAWQARCIRIGHNVRTGEWITWGSLIQLSISSSHQS